MSADTAAPPSSPSSSLSAQPDQGDSVASTDPASHDLWPWAVGGLLGLVAIVVLVRSLRPR